MTAYSFDNVVGQSIAFDQDADDLNIAYDANSVTFTQSGSDLIVTVAGVGTVTLTGTTLGELVGSGANQNISVATGSLVVGDNTTNDALDATDNNLGAGTTGNDLLYGMDGADTINTGATGDDVVFGGEAMTDSNDGGDTITAGTTGSLTLYSNAGNDTITLGATLSGKSVMANAGLGNDTLTLGAGVAGSTVNVNMAAGNDTVNTAALAGTLNLIGGLGNDILNTSTVTGDVSITGGDAFASSTDGGDTITQGAHNAVIYANGGVDTVNIAGKASGTTSVNAGVGNDIITDGATVAIGAHTLQGGWDDDTITVTDAGVTSVVVHGGNNSTDTNDGDDTISVTDGGALASATILGNSGTDTITYNGTDNTVTATASINGGLGNDAVNVIASANDTVTVNVGAGDDTVDVATTGDTNVTLSGFASGDSLINLDFGNGGAVAASALTVGLGTNSIVLESGANGAVILDGYLGDLDLTLADGSKLIANFEGGAATLTGTANANDYLIAGSAGDTFSFAEANFAATDKVEGGIGTDILTFTDAPTITAAELANKTSIETVLFADFASGIVMGTASEATGITNVDASALTAANALTITDTGAVATDGVSVTGGAGNDNVVLDAATGDLILTGNSGNDTLETGGGNDTLDGGAGNDALTGGAGTDSISGGSGTDTLIGNGGNDTIDGGAGADDITGGAGTDSLTGGADADDFIFTAATDSTATAAAVDVITDFNADGDTLDMVTTTGSGDAVAFVDGTAADYDTGNATLNAAATAFIAAEAGLQAADAAGIFNYGGKTYAIVNDDADATFATGDGDYIVDITGYTGSFGVTDFVLT